MSDLLSSFSQLFLFMWVIEEIKAEFSAPNTAISVFFEALFDAVMSPMWSGRYYPERWQVEKKKENKRERWRDLEEEKGSERNSGGGTLQSVTTTGAVSLTQRADEQNAILMSHHHIHDCTKVVSVAENLQNGNNVLHKVLFTWPGLGFHDYPASPPEFSSGLRLKIQKKADVWERLTGRNSQKR